MARKQKRKRLQKKHRRERTWKEEPGVLSSAGTRTWREEGESAPRRVARLIGEDPHTGKPDFKPNVTAMVLAKMPDGNFKLRGSLRGAKYAHCLMRMVDGTDDWHHAVTRYAQHPERWRECIPLKVSCIIELILQGPTKYDEYKLVAAQTTQPRPFGRGKRERLPQAAGEPPPRTPRAMVEGMYAAGSAMAVLFEALWGGKPQHRAALQKLTKSDVVSRLRCLHNDGTHKHKTLRWKLVEKGSIYRMVMLTGGHDQKKQAGKKKKAGSK